MGSIFLITSKVCKNAIQCKILKNCYLCIRLHCALHGFLNSNFPVKSFCKTNDDWLLSIVNQNNNGIQNVSSRIGIISNHSPNYSNFHVCPSICHLKTKQLQFLQLYHKILPIKAVLYILRVKNMHLRLPMTKIFYPI